MPLTTGIPRLLAAAALMLLAGMTQAAGSAVVPEACDGCHGFAGHSAGPTIPSLAGQVPEYFVLAMQRFRNGQRPATVMGPLAKGLSDADFRAMAAYYARQKALPQTAPIDPAQVAAGRKIYFAHCNTCHLDGRLWSSVHQNRGYEKECSKRCHLDYGPEPGDETPLIGGQWREYLAIELAAFKNGTRKMSPRKAKAFERLTPADLAAVAAFYASQKDLTR